MCGVVGLTIVTALVSYPYLQPTYESELEDDENRQWQPVLVKDKLAQFRC
jgi:hypothetical protein